MTYTDLLARKTQLHPFYTWARCAKIRSQAEPRSNKHWQVRWASTPDASNALQPKHPAWLIWSECKFKVGAVETIKTNHRQVAAWDSKRYTVPGLSNTVATRCYLSSLSVVGLNELVRLGFPHSTLSSLNCIISAKFNKFIRPIHPIKLRPFAAKQQSISSQTEVQQQRSPNLQSQFNLFAMTIIEENTSGELTRGILLAD